MHASTPLPHFATAISSLTYCAPICRRKGLSSKSPAARDGIVSASAKDSRTVSSSRAILLPRRASIDARIRDTGATNVRQSLALDATAALWPIEAAGTVLCINMIHIALWRAACGLFAGGARLLPAGGPLYLYGPFKREGGHTAPSNEAFDASLKQENPDWGVRELEAVASLAAACGFGEPAIIEMPANNLSLIFRRKSETSEAPI